MTTRIFGWVRKGFLFAFITILFAALFLFLFLLVPKQAPNIAGKTENHAPAAAGATQTTQPTGEPTLPPAPSPTAQPKSIPVGEAPTAIYGAGTSEYTCPISGSSTALMITNTALNEGTDTCLLTSLPIQVDPGLALGGFTLTYPQGEDLILYEDGQESFFLNGIRVMHTITDQPLAQIEQSRRVYEYVSFPALLNEETARSETTLGKHAVVVLDLDGGNEDIRQYWVRSDEPGISGQYDLLIFEIRQNSLYDGWGPGSTGYVEDIVASLEFSANTHVINLSPGIALPTRPAAEPNGVLTAGEHGDLQALDPQGQLLGKISLPGLVSIDDLHVLGSFTGDARQLQLVNVDRTPGKNQEVTFYQGENILKRIADTSVNWMNAAQDLPMLAYTTTTNFELVFGKAADFPFKPLDDPRSMIINNWPAFLYPYALYAQAGEPKGVWITGRWSPDDSISAYDSFGWGLTYIDIAPQPGAGPARHQILPTPDVFFFGLSGDYTRVAYTATFLDLHILDLQTRKDISIPLDPERGTPNIARFSADNRWLAWMEFSGEPKPPDGGDSTLHSRVRVASLGDQTGEVTVDLQDEQFANAAGFTLDLVEPVGWLDGQTLLVQASKHWSDEIVLLSLHVPDGKITLFSKERFISFLYPPS